MRFAREKEESMQMQTERNRRGDEKGRPGNEPNKKERSGIRTQKEPDDNKYLILKIITDTPLIIEKYVNGE